MSEPSRRQVLSLTAASLTAASLAQSCALTPETVALGHGAWRLPEKHPVEIIEHQWLVMSDGVRLSARVWLPAGAREQPAPAVLEYIPYRKRDSYRPYDDAWGSVLASYGFSFVRVDVRGSGDSEGVLTDEYADAELTDGVACIAWIAAQPWCSGAVGMRGISWGGINTLKIAAMNPPALRAIMPMCCTDNSYSDDAHYIGGTLGHTNFQWGTSFKVVMAAPPDPEIVGADWTALWRKRLDATPSILGAWTSHQTFDSYWSRSAVSLAYERIRTPTYLVSGWQDTYCKPVLRLFANLSCPKKCLVGPWGHTYPSTADPRGLDWAHEEVRWWTHWLKGRDTGIMAEPIMKAFIGYAPPSRSIPAPLEGRWVAESAWPRPAAPMVLAIDGRRLAHTVGSSQRLVVAGGKIVGLTKPEWLDRPPVEQSLDDNLCLRLETEPLTDDVEILGSPCARLRIAATKTRAQAAVRLTEVTPDGESWLVSYGLLNLTHRDSDASPSLLEPGKFYDVRLEMFPIGHRFATGSRLRLSLSEGLWPLAWPSPEPTDLVIDTGASQLELPVRTREATSIDLGIPEKIARRVGDQERPRTMLEPISPGRYRLENIVPVVERRIEDTRTILTRGSWEISEISAGDPLSCLWSQRSESTWRRDAWNCAVEAGYELHATKDKFILSEFVVARRDGAVFAEKRLRSEIDRQWC